MRSEAAPNALMVNFHIKVYKCVHMHAYVGVSLKRDMLKQHVHILMYDQFFTFPGMWVCMSVKWFTLRVKYTCLLNCTYEYVNVTCN